MASGESPAGRERLWAALVVLVLCGGVVGLALATSGEGRDGFERSVIPPRKVKQLGEAVTAAACSLRRFPKEGDGTTSKRVTYRSNPPHSGRHAPEPAGDGAYYAHGPPAEAVVHALRHGRITVWFDPELDEVDKGRLKRLFDEDSPHMILTPREGLPYPVAASAWRSVLGCDEVRDATFDALRAFRDRFRDHGPEFVP